MVDPNVGTADFLPEIVAPRRLGRISIGVDVVSVFGPPGAIRATLATFECVARGEGCAVLI